jgi:hypothetical protein
MVSRRPVGSDLGFIVGRIVPNYELAPNLEHIDILRVVVRESMTEVVRLLISMPLSLD